jgi:hypothetical protein
MNRDPLFAMVSLVLTPCLLDQFPFALRASWTWRQASPASFPFKNSIPEMCQECDHVQEWIGVSLKEPSTSVEGSGVRGEHEDERMLSHDVTPDDGSNATLLIKDAVYRAVVPSALIFGFVRRFACCS